jgi:hypothetical protein
MEYWNNGILGIKSKRDGFVAFCALSPFFHHSIFPLFQFWEEGGKV